MRACLLTDVIYFLICVCNMYNTHRIRFVHHSFIILSYICCVCDGFSDIHTHQWFVTSVRIFNLTTDLCWTGIRGLLSVNVVKVFRIFLSLNVRRLCVWHTRATFFHPEECVGSNRSGAFLWSCGRKPWAPSLTWTLIVLHSQAPKNPNGAVIVCVFASI